MANYVQQTWTDNVTPVDASHMTHLEQGLGAAVPADSVTVAATRVLANLLLGTDTQPAFQVLGDGKHQWGPGGSTAPDTNLYRLVAGAVTTDGRFVSRGGVGIGFNYNPVSASGNPFVSQIQGEANARFFSDFSGKLQWGPGAAVAVDTNLYRTAAGVLKTDGQLNAVGANFGFQYNPAAVGGYGFQSLIAAEANPRFRIAADGKHDWGAGGATAVDTNLYRAAAATLRTDTSLLVGGVSRIYGGELSVFHTNATSYSWQYNRDFMAANQGAMAFYDSAGAEQIRIGPTVVGGNAGIGFGPSQDTNLYRLGSASLGTSGSFTVAATMSCVNLSVTGSPFLKVQAGNLGAMSVLNLIQVYNSTGGGFVGYIPVYG